jgi:hypothetical protein
MNEDYRLPQRMEQDNEYERYSECFIHFNRKSKKKPAA